MLKKVVAVLALAAVLGLAAGCDDIEIVGGYLGWPGEVLYSWYEPGYVVEEYWVEPAYYEGAYYEETYYEPGYFFP